MIIDIIFSTLLRIWVHGTSTTIGTEGQPYVGGIVGCMVCWARNVDVRVESNVL